MSTKQISANINIEKVNSHEKVKCHDIERSKWMNFNNTFVNKVH